MRCRAAMREHAVFHSGGAAEFCTKSRQAQNTKRMGMTAWRPPPVMKMGVVVRRK
jgi:hypothetical protein